MLAQLNNCQIQGIIFDMDGVLVDTSPSHAQAYQKLWQTLAVSGPEYLEIAGRSTIEVVGKYASHLSLEQQQAAVTLKQGAALDILRTADITFVDTKPALQRLSAIAMPMVVATSASQASANLALENAQIQTLFKQVITSADVERSKPAPDLFLAAIDVLGLPAEQCLIVEDSQSGIAAALASGAYAVTVREAETLTDHLCSHPAYLGHYSTLADLIEALLLGSAVNSASNEERLL